MNISAVPVTASEMESIMMRHAEVVEAGFGRQLSSVVDALDQVAAILGIMDRRLSTIHLKLKEMDKRLDRIDGPPH